MLKRFFKDSILYTIATFLTKGIGLILLPIYTNLLSPSEYGVFDYITAIGAIVAISVSLEIGQSVFRFLPEYINDKVKSSKIITSGILVVAVSYVFFTLIIFVYSENVSNLLFDTPSKSFLVCISSLVFLFNGFINLINLIYRARLESKKSVYFSLVNAIFTAAISFLFLVYFKLGVEGLMLGQLISAIILVVLGGVNIRSTFVFDFDVSTLKEMLSFSVPIIPSSLGVIIAMFSDRLMIKEFLSFQELGVYGVALRVASIITLITIGTRSALSPLIYTYFKNSETPDKIQKIFTYYVIGSSLLIIMFTFYSDFIVNMIAPIEYAEAKFVIPIISLAVIIGNMYIFFPGLLINKKTGLISLINITAGILNIILNFIFIPLYGMYAAALTTLFTSTLALVFQYYFSQKLYRIPNTSLYLFSSIISLMILIMFNINL